MPIAGKIMNRRSVSLDVDENHPRALLLDRFLLYRLNIMSPHFVFNRRIFTFYYQ